MLLTIDQVAEKLQTTTRTVRRAWYAGLLPAPIRLGRRGIRWRAADLIEFIESQTPVTPEGKTENV